MAYSKRIYGTIEERFWPKVDKSGGPDACWPWLAGTDQDGYGTFNKRKAHRTGYELTTGETLTTAIKLCHSCDNPPCCNPKHVFKGTQADNVQDALLKSRLGHKLDREKVERIFRMNNAGVPSMSIAQTMGVHHSMVRLIINGKSWPHLQYLRNKETEWKNENRVSEEQVIAVHKLANEGVNLAEIGRRLGVKHITVHAIRKGRIYKQFLHLAQ